MVQVAVGWSNESCGFPEGPRSGSTESPEVGFNGSTGWRFTLLFINAETNVRFDMKETHMKSRRLLVLLLALMLGAAACGSDGEATAEAAPLIVVEGTQTPALDSPDADASVDEPDADASNTAADQTDEERALAFTQCMREEGVDLADPTVNADGSIQLFQPGANNNIDPDDPATADAVEVCGDLIAGASFLPGAGMDQSEVEDTLLGFAQCLRDLGIDVDDPDLSGGFAGGPAAIFGDGFDPADPATADAVRTCQATFGAGGNAEGNN